MKHRDSLNIGHPIMKPGTRLLGYGSPSALPVYAKALQYVLGGNPFYNPVTTVFESKDLLGSETPTLEGVAAYVDGDDNRLLVESLDAWNATYPIIYYSGYLEDNGIAYQTLLEKRSSNLDQTDSCFSLYLNSSTQTFEFYLFDKIEGPALFTSNFNFTYGNYYAILVGFDVVQSKMFMLIREGNGAVHYESGPVVDYSVFGYGQCAIGQSTWTGFQYKHKGRIDQVSIGNHVANFKLLCDGDSITAGQGLTEPLTYPEQIRGDFASVLKVVTTSNFGVSGAKVSEMNAAAPAGIDLEIGASSNIIVAMCGINDIGTGETVADTYAAIVTYCSNRVAAGALVYYCTILPANVASVDEAERQELNNLILTNLISDAGIAGVIDTGADPVIGLVDSPDDTDYYQVDKVHLTALGQKRLSRIIFESLKDVLPLCIDDLNADYIFTERAGTIAFDRSAHQAHAIWEGTTAGGIGGSHYSEDENLENKNNVTGYKNENGLIIPSRIDINFNSTGVNALGGELDAAGNPAHNLKFVDNPVLEFTAGSYVQSSHDPISTNHVTIYVAAKPTASSSSQYDRAIVDNGMCEILRDENENAWSITNNYSYPVAAGEDSFKLDVWNHVFCERKASGLVTFHIGYGNTIPQLSGDADMDAGPPTNSGEHMRFGSSIYDTEQFIGKMQTVLIFAGAVSEADRMKIWQGDFANIEATLIDGYTIGEHAEDSVYSLITGVAPAVLINALWSTDEHARPDFIMDGGDVWENDLYPGDPDHFLYIALKPNGESIKTNGDVIPGYTWLSKNPAGSFHNGGPSSLENYEADVLKAADPDHLLFDAGGVPKKLSYASRQFDYDDHHYMFSDASAKAWTKFMLFEDPQSGDELAAINEFINKP